jgi:uncharacterized protein (DUF983 family)
VTWVNQMYKNPTQAQLLAEKARGMLHELGVECSCEHGETPEEYYFEFHGEMYPSYIPTTKMCRKCELNNLLYGIQDPDDLASVYT